VRSVPANFGPLKGANANARITGPCGDTMEFWLMIHDDHIRRATFTTDGCGASIASGAMVARLADAETLDPQQQS
jgi:nitrogen fixation NifU-like protein